jgi:hypothetical protein
MVASRQVEIFMKIKVCSSCFLLLLLISLVASGCSFPGRSSDAERTLSVTEAYQTVEARLTEGAIEKPTQSPTHTITALPTNTPSSTPATATPTNTATIANAVSSPASTCDQAAAGNPIDVTIPDDTDMQPGEVFTKVWRLQNAGTCTWTKEYKAVLFSGDGMSAPSVVQLPEVVSPGETVDISADMVAPETEGTYQGNWKLQNEEGSWFGIGPSGGSVFWVRIIVGASGDISPSPTGSVVTETVNPDVLVSGAVSLQMDDGLDLDSKSKNNGEEDLILEKDDQDFPFIAATGSAQIGYHGGGQPTAAICQATSLGSSPVYLQDISGGSYFCFSTNAGKLGWLQAIDYNSDQETLSIQMLTWDYP